MPQFSWAGRSGSSNCAIYDGEDMAKKGVVFVSLNYRVGVFGFMGHSELSKESGHNASGNYGFMDQMAALSWIQKILQRLEVTPIMSLLQDNLQVLLA